MEKQPAGQRYKNERGRETYEIDHAEPGHLERIARILHAEFGFKQQGETSQGLDEVYMNFSNGQVTLVLGWGNWSGCFIYAERPEGDEYITIIGNHMDTVLGTL